jgi:hypothetical protein
MFLQVLLVYLTLVVLIAAAFAFIARTLPPEFQESREIATSIYMMVPSAFICIIQGFVQLDSLFLQFVIEASFVFGCCAAMTHLFLIKPLLLAASLKPANRAKLLTSSETSTLGSNTVKPPSTTAKPARPLRAPSVRTKGPKVCVDYAAGAKGPRPLGTAEMPTIVTFDNGMCSAHSYRLSI